MMARRDGAFPYRGPQRSTEPRYLLSLRNVEDLLS
jgi:hypothetical protein